MTVKFKFNENFNSCPDCDSLNSIVYNEDRAEQTCHECGFVVKDSEDVFNFCSDCGAHNSIIYNIHTSERTCSQCGLVIEERIIDISNGNARFYSKEERNRKAQNGPLISNHTTSFSLSTPIPPVRNRDQYRVFKLNLQVNNQNRNLRKANVQLNRIYANLKLPKTNRGESEFISESFKEESN